MSHKKGNVPYYAPNIGTSCGINENLFSNTVTALEVKVHRGGGGSAKKYDFVATVPMQRWECLV